MDRRGFIKTLTGAGAFGALDPEKAEAQARGLAERIEEIAKLNFVQLSQALGEKGDLSLDTVMTELNRSETTKRSKLVSLFNLIAERSFRLVSNASGEYLKTRDEKKYEEIIQEYFKYQLLIDYFRKENGLSARIGRELFGGKTPDQAFRPDSSADEKQFNLFWSVISKRQHFDELYSLGRRQALGLSTDQPSVNGILAYQALKPLKDIGKDPALASPITPPKF